MRRVIEVHMAMLWRAQEEIHALARRGLQPPFRPLSGMWNDIPYQHP
eukprot:CAMPEP_0181257810 /NCGR_PEP_ID=MMETSP1096-20121128/50447_1 /TAXON_ID=156174 ORGANISM="Chrysochromulina ericina, Strain CCMP281" /NCGR_SAMPLE_ID=MMETSP1096 /ASSEMBLY_ACC=CAM_ASM_000453 /LENGTH=46 /DNA_ID= /DNA_START= /DNA_END= /DNA_ORIENTATION=